MTTSALRQPVPKPDRIDPITTSVIQGALENIAIEMGYKLMRMSYSSIIRESEDFGAALVDAEGRFYIDNNEVLNPGVETLKDAIVRVAGDDRARPVVLRADARTQHQAVITAMDALGQLGFDRLSLATMPNKAPEQR